MTPPEALGRLRAYEPLVLPPAGSREAAVLVPLRARGGSGDLEIILTRRTDTLAHHRGQVAFPGGMIEPTDVGPEAAALREAHEELDLAPAHVEIVSRLDDLVTGTGFHIVPIVGLVHPRAELVPNGAEVARVFTVPLVELMRAAAWEQRAHEREGARYVLWHYVHDGEDIWGATGAILRGMMQVLGAF